MKNIIFGTLALLASAPSFSQILDPVKWSYATKKTSENEAVVYLKATIEKGWHIYSQELAEGGPAKTNFNFAQSSSFKRMGKTVEPTPVTVFEDVFKMEVSYFSNSVIFKQPIQLLEDSAVIKGTIEYMACNDAQCLPPKEVEFTVPITK